MTPEEAIAVFDKMLKRYNWAEDNKSVQAIKVAKESIEKQIAKKPRKIQHIATSYDYSTKTATRLFRGSCPECNMLNTNRRVGEQITHCEKCGQALDWSEEE